MTVCPVCGRPADAAFLEMANVPVFCNVLWPTAEAAQAASTGRISLAACPSCEMVWNLEFDPDAVAYAPGYENSLHYSGVFQSFAAALAERLVDRYGLAGKQVVDIGCGTGEFLALLCAGGRNRGVGYDPSFAGTRGLDVPPTVSFVADVYTGPETPGDRPDFISCRHVLEHVADPVAFLGELRAGLGSGGETVVYCEVPAGDSMLLAGAVWDVIYEHPSYFTAPALRALFRRAGFSVLDQGWSFGDQYLWIEATTERREEDGDVDLESERSAHDAVTRFAATFHSSVRSWQLELERLAADGGAAVWGAGSKGVSFLNAVPAGRDVSLVVDVSPRKHGRHIPGTGHPVVAPSELATSPVATVIAMNPLYRAEIEHTLAAFGVVDAEVVPA